MVCHMACHHAQSTGALQQVLYLLWIASILSARAAGPTRKSCRDAVTIRSPLLSDRVGEDCGGRVVIFSRVARPPAATDHTHCCGIPPHGYSTVAAPLQRFGQSASLLSECAGFSPLPVVSSPSGEASHRYSAATAALWTDVRHTWRARATHARTHARTRTP